MMVGIETVPCTDCGNALGDEEAVHFIRNNFTGQGTPLCEPCKNQRAQVGLQRLRNQTLRDAAPVKPTDEHGFSDEERAHLEENLGHRPQFYPHNIDEAWQQKNAGEPMDIAWQLLKEWDTPLSEPRFDYHGTDHQGRHIGAASYASSRDPSVRRTFPFYTRSGGGSAGVDDPSEGARAGDFAPFFGYDTKGGNFSGYNQAGQYTTSPSGYFIKPAGAAGQGHVLMQADADTGERSQASGKDRYGGSGRMKQLGQWLDANVDTAQFGENQWTDHHNANAWLHSQGANMNEHALATTEEENSTGIPWKASEPMEVAMRLLKAPFDPSSIKQLPDAQQPTEITPSQYFTDPNSPMKRRWEAEFIHPKSGKRSMFDAYMSRGQPHEEGSWLRVQNREGSEAEGEADVSYLDEDPFEEGGHRWISEGVGVPENQRGAGIGSSMYDLIAHLIAGGTGSPAQKGRFLRDDEQSPEAHEMWERKNEGMGSWMPDNLERRWEENQKKASEPMDIVMRLLKEALYSPKSGYKDEKHYPKRALKIPPHGMTHIAQHYWNRIGTAQNSARARKFRESQHDFPLKRYPRWPHVERNVVSSGKSKDMSRGERPLTYQELDAIAPGLSLENNFRTAVHPENVVGSTRSEMRPKWWRDKPGPDGRWLSNREGDDAWNKIMLPEGMHDIPEEDA